MALLRRGPVVSADAWGDRRLGQLIGSTWRQFSNVPGWFREPRALSGERVGALRHEKGDETAEAVIINGNAFEPFGERRWRLGEIAAWSASGITAIPSSGHVPGQLGSGYSVKMTRRGATLRVALPNGTLVLPKGVLVTDIVASPDDELLAITLRHQARTRLLVVQTESGKVVAQLDRTVEGRAAWSGRDTLIALESRWPMQMAIAWHVVRGLVKDLVEFPPYGGAIRSPTSNEALLAFAISSPNLPRSLVSAPVDSVWDIAPLRLPHEMTGVTAVTISGEAGPIPCVVRRSPRGSDGLFVMLSGGPQESVWPEFSPLADALNLRGWDVVQPNLRGGSMRSPLATPGLTARYGVDDLADVGSVIRTFEHKRVVVGGSSYGGYLAARAGAAFPRVIGGVVLSGFMEMSDLRASRHPQVREFLGAFIEPGRKEPDPRVPLFVAHGTDDERIPIEVIDSRVRTLSDHSQYVRLIGEGHAVRSDQAARETYPSLFAWLDSR